MILATAEATHIENDRYDQNEQIDSFDGHRRIYHPGVCQRGERQEDEPKQRQEQAVIGPGEVIRKEEKYQPTLYVEPASKADSGFATALGESIKKIALQYPGVTIEKTANAWKVIIPDNFKIGHEAHFGQVMERFLKYLKEGKLPEWEVPGMLAKYYLTTYGSAMAER